MCFKGNKVINKKNKIQMRTKKNGGLDQDIQTFHRRIRNSIWN